MENANLLLMNDENASIETYNKIFNSKADVIYVTNPSVSEIQTNYKTATSTKGKFIE